MAMGEADGDGVMNVYVAIFVAEPVVSVAVLAGSWRLAAL